MQTVRQNLAKILIVDDDTILASLYRIKLQNAGFLVEIAESGEGGLLKISQSAPDVVVLDLMLGDMNGVEVLEMLRANPTTRNLPVLVFSSAFLGGLVDDALKAGATKALNKANCPPNRLIEEIQSILAHLAAGHPVHEIASGTATAPPARLEPRMVAPPRPPPMASMSAPAPAAPAAPPAGPAWPAPGGAPRAADEELQGAAVRRDLLEQVRRRIDDAVRALPGWLKNPRNPDAPYLGAMYRAVRGIVGSASLAGRVRLSQVAGGFEALLREVKRAAAQMPASVPRTVEHALELLPKLAEGDETQTEVLPSSLILIFDEDAESREATSAALQTAQLHPLCVGEMDVAIRLLSWNRFDLVLFHLDRGDASERFAAYLAASLVNNTAPVVVFSDAPDPASVSLPAGIRAADVIARPVNPVELAVKALIAIHTGAR